ncbi:MTH1187 family thiamine-binding protein [Paenibacillus sp. HN-1]|uniref:MTH1187 family thiamine-binding protein n=1 Tax=Paenibacillus TaxID=44249 RepID=UPI001CA95BAD|nr:MULTISPECIES: MTH1187 family thiamine-binding protein [Paenibacillus]MBY9079999.1 MTH1187 family thiamine-binding protein [Paenibacillus sp. CGMCC 1.18879]MBY9086697.1 MTH1187 family thiamine-binding protein [Paenibacillus sinensis]
MAIAEITVIPIGTGSTSLSSYVADMQRALESVEGITYELTSMGTIIEGPISRIFAAVEVLHESPFNGGAQRVSTSLKIDDRRDKAGSSRQKLESVERKLQSE